MATVGGQLCRPLCLTHTKTTAISGNGGFPASNRCPFAPTGTGGLAVTGFYATQYIVERAYGNYLGLCRLGQFMAHEMGLRFEQLTCIATPAKRDGSKSALKPLAQSVRALVGAAPGWEE